MFKSIVKRVLPLLLSVLMLFSVMPMQAIAEEATETAAVSSEPAINDYESFLYNLALLEELAYVYTSENPGVDPLDLVIKYIRTGVDRYNSGSWNIMAGYEDTAFAEFVIAMQDAINEEAPSEEEKLHIDALKNINNFTLPNGDNADLGHVFGTMDITYHNSGSENHADVGGWAGDLVDLLELSDIKGVTGTLEEMVADISENYLGKDYSPTPGFSLTDIQGDIDAYYIMQSLYNTEYESGVLTEIFANYFTEDLNDKQRAKYLLENRLGTTGTRSQIREVVYSAYTNNKVIKTLEGTRTFNSDDLVTLRKACCYAFADYLCSLAGDYVETTENRYVSVFSTETSTLAPGITQEIKYATSADNKQMVYYVATADITRSDVNVYANYNNNDPSAGWAMSRVLDQANAAQEKYGDPDSKNYIENYNVIAATNGAGFNMSTGEPSGLLVMGGVEYQAINSNGFFGILKDGTAVIGSTEEYNTVYKDKVQEGIAVFGATLVKDGEIAVSETTDYYDDRASRTAVGITKTGKVVLMVLDGRQEPVSCGGSMIEIAQIMLEAGCVNAVNLDGGGSTTYVAKQVGDDELSVVNKPSDGFARSVSTSLMMVSTAPSSTKFDHAVIESDYNYLTIGTTLKLNAIGVSATGNTTELPEGAYWEVSDTRWGTVTEDGEFTALRNGTVDVYLMSDGEIIGSKTLNVVTPDNIYYTKTVIDAVYGATVKLPVVVLYQNKPVAVNENDIVFSLSSPTAGKISGFNFVGDETSGIKVVVITAALASDNTITADTTVNLYNQGEATFDFDQATGGDRQLAWDRQISNTTTEDEINYTIVDAGEDMVTSYIMAIDMTEIPIPEVLSDLVYMLPGADVEGANAWMFLCQLAERVSTLTEVKARIQFDLNFDVDYSGLTLVNEYFTLKETAFDTNTNTLTLTLKWKKQTQAIDTATANPLCIVSGIKLTPKTDADWGDKNRIAAVNTGDISYKVYLRASALYSFAQKEENQQTYGLYPYVNPDDSSDAGGAFGETYKEFYDSYTLINAVKEGWVYENGGMAYYVDGEKLTGICEVEGYYYDFGENGINNDQTKYTGVFLDESAGVYRYSKLGVLTSGWNMIGGEWYYFRPSTNAAAIGRTKLYGVYYTFEETGRLTTGVWANTLYGTRYYYGPAFYQSGWQIIDGERYYFRNGYRLTGYQYVSDYNSVNLRVYKWHDFGNDGKDRGFIPDGFYDFDGKYYYIIDGVNQVGLQKVGEDYYFFRYNGVAVTNENYYAFETHCDLPCGKYEFGADGKMLEGIIEKEDGYYYYVTGKAGREYGLQKIGDDYYLVLMNGKLVTGRKANAWVTNCDLPKGDYYFDDEGKLANGIVTIDGDYYYYVNGKVSEEYGLIKVGDDYYLALMNGKLVTGRVANAWVTSCDLPKGNYEFGEDGKMLQGIVEKEDGYYYYLNGKAGREYGLVKVGDDYYLSLMNGKLVTGRVANAWVTSCDLPKGNYEFGEDGKMLQGIVEKEDGYYYYLNGKAGREYGLVKVGDDYYLSLMNGKLVTGRVANAWVTSCDLPTGNYEFGEDGKMLQGIVEKEDGYYYYLNGRAGREYGLVKVGDDYYLALMNGKLVTDKVANAWVTNCNLPKGDYEFGADGKMLHGIVEKSDGYYYYVNGVAGREYGLVKIEDDYYLVLTNGKLVTGRVANAWVTNCDLPKGNYEFGEDGKMLDGIVEKSDGYYYYVKGKTGTVYGAFQYNGYYYFALMNGKLITDCEYDVWQGNGLLVETTYTFNEFGQIVA